jgi:hypothetical protein
MIEILIEELTRYQDLSLEDIPVFPIEEDLWAPGKDVKKVVSHQT